MWLGDTETVTAPERHSLQHQHHGGHSSHAGHHGHAAHGGHGRHVAHPRRAIKPDALPARFRVHAPHAKKVLLVCPAVSHQPQPMHPTGDGYWQLLLELKRGRYEYHLLVDGERHLDPKSRGTVTHADGTRYSVMEVGY